MFGYNGFGRLTGNETGSVGGGRQGRRPLGSNRMTRLFEAEMGGQVSWLLPATLYILLVAGIAAAAPAPPHRPDPGRTLLWGGWLVVTGVTFSLGQGIIHPYYTVALAPAIEQAMVGIGVSTWWRQALRTARSRHPGRLSGGHRRLVVHAAAGGPRPGCPGCPRLFAVSGIAITALLLAIPRLRGRLAVAVGGTALVVALASPATYSLSTAADSA